MPLALTARPSLLQTHAIAALIAPLHPRGEKSDLDEEKKEHREVGLDDPEEEKKEHRLVHNLVVRRRLPPSPRARSSSCPPPVLPVSPRPRRIRRFPTCTLPLLLLLALLAGLAFLLYPFLAAYLACTKSTGGRGGDGGKRRTTGEREFKKAQGQRRFAWARLGLSGLSYKRDDGVVAQSMNEDESKVEYRVWNPFRSKLAAAVLGGVDNIWIDARHPAK